MKLMKGAGHSYHPLLQQRKKLFTLVTVAMLVVPTLLIAQSSNREMKNGREESRRDMKMSDSTNERNAVKPSICKIMKDVSIEYLK